jgi:hypothetical protein
MTNSLMSKIRHQYSIYSPPLLPFLALILPNRPFSKSEWRPSRDLVAEFVGLFHVNSFCRMASQFWSDRC